MLKEPLAPSLTFLSLPAASPSAEVQWDQGCHWSPPRPTIPCRRGLSSGIQSHCRWRKFLKLWRKDLSKDFFNLAICRAAAVCPCALCPSGTSELCADLPRPGTCTMSFIPSQPVYKVSVAVYSVYCTVKCQWQGELWDILGAAEPLCRGGFQDRVGMAQPDLGRDCRKLLERNCVESALAQKADLNSSLKMRVCPAKVHQGLLSSLCQLLNTSWLSCSRCCQDGSFGFFFIFLSVLIKLHPEVQNCSVISGCLVRQRSEQVHLKSSAFWFPRMFCYHRNFLCILQLSEDKIPFPGLVTPAGCHCCPPGFAVPFGHGLLSSAKNRNAL